MKKTDNSNDPSSATAADKNGGKSQSIQVSENVQQTSEAAVRWSALVRCLFESETSKFQSNSNLQALQATLNSTTLGFDSLSSLFLHLEEWPKTLGALDKRSHYLLKPLLTQWQKADRPDISWHDISKSFGFRFRFLEA